MEDLPDLLLNAGEVGVRTPLTASRSACCMSRSSTLSADRIGSKISSRRSGD